jgi:hypothetical protein
MRQCQHEHATDPFIGASCLPRVTELLRENKRQLDKAIRELDRERMGLQTQEKRIIADIKKMAKEGQMVRERAYQHGRSQAHCCGRSR